MHTKFLAFCCAISLQVASGFNTMFYDFAFNAGMNPCVLVAEQMTVAALILTPLALFFER
ncbi:predicted protein [Arabidopsis lyrata subsp. lyrata]|uniref:Predicted protein n=1 Tax=Arabidopsis lyrata subsp. lyrata TaxID=81972 RepID=D7KBY6_ARALL|nr:predicted protein [Arabidopsis lyrata subsp. lyrata]